ncbi:Helicase associated domain protein [Flindersiella endophytica]
MSDEEPLSEPVNTVLRHLRKQRRMSREKVAERLRWSADRVQRVEQTFVTLTRVELDGLLELYQPPAALWRRIVHTAELSVLRPDTEAETSNRRGRQPMITPEQAAEFREQYDADVSVEEIAAGAGCSVSTVSRSLRTTGEMRPRGSQRGVTPEQAAEFRAKYDAGASIDEIAAESPYSPVTVRRWLEESGGLRDVVRRTRVKPEDAARIRKLYDAGATAEDVAAETGLAKHTVYRWISRTGGARQRGRRRKPAPVNASVDASAPALLPHPQVAAETLAAPELRPRVVEAIKAVIAEIALAGRCRITLAPGVGKTRVGAEVSRQLAEDGRVLVVVPSLPLLAQTAAAYVDHLGDQTGVLAAVCSDPNATRDTSQDTGQDTGESATERAAVEADAESADDAVADTETWDIELAEELAELRVGSSTDPGEVHAWTRLDGRLTVFCTYHSLGVVAEAHRLGTPAWDLVVLDEAHRAAGARESSFGIVNDDAHIPAQRRLYMTATPRVLDENRRGEVVPVYSMHDERVFGREVYRVPVGQAIDEGILADYRMLVCTMTPGELERLQSDEAAEALTATDEAPAVPPEMLVAQLALLKAAGQYGVRTALSFHHRVVSAQLFAETLPYAAQLLPAADRPFEVNATAIHGTMDPTERRRILHDLGQISQNRQDGQQAQDGRDTLLVVPNARALTEGIDVPELDAVLFADPRDSTVDVVQAVGRALRRGQREDKTATVIIPILLPEADSADGSAGAEVALNGSQWQILYRILRAMRDQDERLADWLDRLRAAGTRGTRASSKPQLPPWLELVGTQVDQAFADALALRVLERTTSAWLVGYGAAQAYAAKYGNLLVHGDHVTDDGLHLGNWIAHQRVAYKRGELAADRIVMLNQIGMSWDALEAAWQEGYAAAEAYYAKKGHLRVTNSFVTADGYNLGNWIAHQRVVYRRGELTADRIEMLERIGVCWDILEVAWQEGYAAAKACYTNKGHLRVTNRFVTADGYNLGPWLDHQRTLRKRGSLSAERINALDDIGMVWDLRKADQEEYLALARAFHAEHGHLNVPDTVVTRHGKKLNVWLQNQRARKNTGKPSPLKPEEIQALDELGMDWGHRDRWQTNLQAAADYHARHGHLKPRKGEITTPTGLDLSTWLSNLRHKARVGQLPPERIQALDDIGMIWNLEAEKWREHYAAAVTFFAAHGHLNPPPGTCVGDVDLYRWHCELITRKHELTDEQIAGLEALSINWERDHDDP